MQRLRRCNPSVRLLGPAARAPAHPHGGVVEVHRRALLRPCLQRLGPPGALEVRLGRLPGIRVAASESAVAESVLVSEFLLS
jgi:hypothetical protein